MPEDADGVWSTLDDRHWGSGPDLRTAYARAAPGIADADGGRYSGVAA